MSAVGLAVELAGAPVLPMLPSAVELAAVRIVQEALTNVLVHAKASRAVVELEFGPTTRSGWRCTTTARPGRRRPSRFSWLFGRPSSALGRPLGPAEAKKVAAAPLGGNGLVGMRERAASCGGTLSIGSSPLGGCW